MLLYIDMAFSLNDKHILVNYHYVEDPSGENHGMHPCPVDEFEKQIAFLSEHYKPATISELFDAAKNNSNKRYYSITFDDGLKSQFVNAVPILKKYGAHGTFFQIGVTREGKIPTTHKIHILLAHISTDELINATSEFLKNKFPDNASKYIISKNKRISPDRRLYEDIPTANLKEVFVSLPNNMLEELVRVHFEKLNLNEEVYCRVLFMNTEEILTLEKDGFTIGNHTYDHYTANTLSEATLRDDIFKSQESLKTILKNSPTIFSYPHGVITEDSTKVVKALNFTHAVTVEMRGVAPGDNPLLIPRYDRVNIRDYFKEKSM